MFILLTAIWIILQIDNNTKGTQFCIFMANIQRFIYYWLLHGGQQQYKWNALLCFHGKNGYVNASQCYVTCTLPFLFLKQWLLLQLYPVVQRKPKKAHKLIRLHMRTFYWPRICVSFSNVTSFTTPKGLNHPEFKDNAKQRINFFF